MATKILLTGVSGFLGWNLFRKLSRSFLVLGTYLHHQPPLPEGKITSLDIKDHSAVEELVREFAPEIIVHTAALTSPAFCLENPAAARSTNRDGTAHLARAAARIGARFIYTSTDRVFNGEKGNYSETDHPDPLGVYGKTKLAGEEEVKSILSDYLIVRLPLMYGRTGPSHGSFIKWMLSAWREKKPLLLFIDQYRTPLYAGDAVKTFPLLIARPELRGTYHLGGGERINRAEFGYRMAEIFSLDPALIVPARMVDTPGIPPTPADVALNSEKLFRAIGFRGRNILEGLQALRIDYDKI